MAERTERFEILKSVVAVAAADGVIAPEELGLIEALAARVGIGRRSLRTLIERARRNQRMHEELGYYDIGDREKAMELMVAAAAIDGEIVVDEVAQISIIATKLGVRQAQLDRTFARGRERAERLRQAMRRGGDERAVQ